MKVARYLRQDARGDAVAGLTVAVMGVPQGMAYALIAGLPPVYGIYTAIIPCAIAAIFGSSRHLVTGPTNALCMLILSLTAHLPKKYGVDLFEVVLYLSFLTGLFQVAFGALRMGGIVRYVSQSVVIGFTAGAGILIAVNQLKNLLGVDISAVHAERSYEVLTETLARVPETNLYALGIGLGTAALVIAIPKISPRIPAALLAILIAGATAYLLGWDDPESVIRIEIVRDMSPISGGFPPFHAPVLLGSFDYELTRELGIGALALSVLGLIEAGSIARAIASRSGQRLNYNREFAAQGAAKVVGSFFSCFASSGSFTRSAVNFKAGGRTRGAATFSAVWTAVALLALGPIANYIPKASLAGLVIVIAYSMVDKRRLGLSWRTGRNSRIVLVGTLGSTLILPLEYAIFAGVSLSIVLLLRTIGRTDLTELVPREGGGFDEVPFNRAAPTPVVTVNMSGALYFAAAEDLDHEMLQCITPKTRVVVLRMKRLRAVGGTAMAMLEHFWEILRQRGITLVVCGIEDTLKGTMTGSGLRRKIGEQNIFYADNRLFQSMELALARAWSIVEREERLSGDLGMSTIALRSRVATAAELMSARCIRFGNQHQVREAAWLMSELHKHQRSISPEPLFLQDKEGKLSGELTPVAHPRETRRRDRTRPGIHAR